MSAHIAGENVQYGDYMVFAFDSAFSGAVHLSVRRDEGAEGDPDRAANVDISPTHARQLAEQLIAAAAKAEQ